jgi:hypothetical protein
MRRVAWILVLAAVLAACGGSAAQPGNPGGVDEPEKAGSPQNSEQAGFPGDAVKVASATDAFPSVGIAAVASIDSPVARTFVSDDCSLIPTRTGMPSELPPELLVAEEGHTGLERWLTAALFDGGRSAVFSANFGPPGRAPSLSIVDDGQGSILGGLAFEGEEWELTQPGAAVYENGGYAGLFRLSKTADGRVSYESYNYTHGWGRTPPGGKWDWQAPVDGLAILLTATFRGRAVENFSSRQDLLEARVSCLLVSKNILAVPDITKDDLRRDWGHVALVPNTRDDRSEWMPVFGFDPSRSEADASRRVDCSVAEAAAQTPAADC